ncbi:MAG: uroporphyrinogen-III synthase [Deltaproteobacteria bacterium]|nr:uroporphyrinogen-III synthase [Deltaproteobacteria bacterium]
MTKKHGEGRPLEGRRVVVTRRGEQAEETCARLEALGAAPIRMPTIAIEPVGDLEPLARALAHNPALIVVSSANAVKPLVTALGDRGLQGAQLCSVGPVTRRRLEEAGLEVAIEAEDYRAEGLVEVLSGRVERGERVLLPVARVTRDVLPAALRARGVVVDVVAVYETVLPVEGEWSPGLRALTAGEVDGILFSSPSTVRNFSRITGAERDSLLASVRVAVIGPVTARACEDLGIDVHVMPARYTLEALLEALVDYWKLG